MKKYSNRRQLDISHHHTKQSREMREKVEQSCTTSTTNRQTKRERKPEREIKRGSQKTSFRNGHLGE